MTTKVIGKKILVEKVFEGEKTVVKNPEWKNVVKVLEVGDGATEWGLKKDDLVIVSGLSELRGEFYIVNELQAFRTL